MHRAPAIWAFESGASAYGVFADGERCWVGNEAGKVFAVDRDGNVVAKFKLPERLEIVTDFPVSGAGKILRRMLRELIETKIRNEQTQSQQV